jgi:hypothetical protein
VLSLSDVEDLYKVSYVPDQAFIVHLPSCDLEFKRTGKLYIANFNQILMKVFTCVPKFGRLKKPMNSSSVATSLPDKEIHLIHDENYARRPDMGI